MNAVGLRIRDARRRADMTQQELATYCGVSRAAVAQWEGGTTRPSLAHLQRAAEGLGVWVSWLTGENQHAGLADEAAPFAVKGRTVPVIDFVRAGTWDMVTDAYPPGSGMSTLVTEQAVGPHAFALVVKGHSMAPEFAENDRIIVDPGVPPRPGDPVIAKLEGQEEATFKKYRSRGNDSQGRPIVDLVPLNEDWPTLRIDAAHPGRIIGTVVEHRRYRRP